MKTYGHVAIDSREERLARAHKLRDLRELLGLNLRQMAHELGATASAVTQWESGKRGVPGTVARLLALYEQEIAPQDAEVELTHGWPRTLNSMEVVLLERLLHAYLPRPSSPIASAVRTALERRYMRRLSSLKGLAVKLAQTVALLDPTVPSEEGAALGQRLRPMPTALVVRTFLRELGGLPTDAFSRWEPKPFAVTSLGQVHRAELNGVVVAVKVQHPDIEKTLRADFDALRPVDRALALVFRAQEPGVIFEAIRERLLDECDYGKEARSQASFRQLLVRREDIVIPEIFPQTSSTRILTSAYVQHGEALASFVARATQDQRDRAGQTIWDFFWETMAAGLFYCDVHPDNFLFMQDAVAVVDFGRVQELEDRLLEPSKDMVRALIENQPDRFRSALERLRMVPRPDAFDFDFAFRTFSGLWRPVLTEARFSFDQAHVVRGWQAFVRDNPNKTASNYPGEMAFFYQMAFSLPLLLAKLGARVRCRQKILELLAT